jgi:hypothetical protein
MSKLTLRWATEKDWPVLVGMGFDIRGLKSENVIACVCSESSKDVGGASGHLDETAQLYMAVAAPGRWDILYSMVEGMNTAAIKFGSKRSFIHVPTDDAKQCTGVTTSAALMTYIGQVTPIATVKDYGKDMAKSGAVAYKEVVTEDLLAQAKALAALLDGLKCTRTWL